MSKALYGIVGLAAGVLLGAGCAGLAQSEGVSTNAVRIDADTATPSPAYIVILGTVHEPEPFNEDYVAKLPALYEKFGGEFIASGFGPVVLEGEEPSQSYAITKWPSKEAAIAFWNSEEYEPLKSERIEKGWGTFDIVLLEGL